MQLSARIYPLSIWLFLAISWQCLAAQATQSTDKVDLSNPGMMADIVSNVLLVELSKEESKVQLFLKDANKRFESGKDVAKAAAKEFGVGEKEMFVLVEKYRDCNSDDNATSIQNTGPASMEPFAQDVLVHVVLHELGHALVREFDLPILGNEETLADAFATHYVVTRIPDRGFQIIEARVKSLMIEAKEVPRAEWTVKGEHNSDARRAYQAVALAIAHDPQKYLPLANLVDMSERQARQAADYGTEIHRSWRRLVRNLRMPEGQMSKEARFAVDDESPFAASLAASHLLKECKKAVGSFDWHSQVTVRFSAGSGGAGWNRGRRPVTVHDDYIQRFNKQAKLAAAMTKSGEDEGEQ